jgi:hypothetical protein
VGTSDWRGVGYIATLSLDYVCMYMHESLHSAYRLPILLLRILHMALPALQS